MDQCGVILFGFGQSKPLPAPGDHLGGVLEALPELRIFEVSVRVSRSRNSRHFEKSSL
jgi:hypothetical protein